PGALFRRQCILAGFLSQRGRSALHLARGLLQIFGHLGQLFLTFNLLSQTSPHAVDDRQRVLAQLLLAGGNSFVIVFPLWRSVFFAFANQAMRGSDQIFLAARQRVLVLITALALTLPTLLLCLAILHFKRSDLD